MTLTSRILTITFAITIGVLILFSCSKSDGKVSDSNDPEIEITEPSSWLEGSWGATFPVFGGERLDTEIAASDFNLVRGAQELVDELPAVGHVISNLSYFAHSHYFTLSKNNNVDIATEIHPSIVPNNDNDEIIFEVLEIFKNSNKKIILYISTNYFDRADDAVQEKWIAYYTTKFNGDEYAAYENLIRGFIEQVKDYADGYWLDTVNSRVGDLVNMIREVDPTAQITANSGKKYLEDNGESVYVDTDGVDDDDDTDYKIIIHEPLNALQDFTHGHVTPLGQGAPPNSWAYEEFTIPNMIANPWADYNGSPVIKHAWFPIRERWHVSTVDLVFDTEQAYRFVKRITDAGASITFANTVDYDTGYMMTDEMNIMKEINDRLIKTPMPDYVPYTRPEGAFLVGE